MRKYFFAVFFFVICPIVGWIIYAHRHNAPANVFLDQQKGEVVSNNVTIPDQKLDFSTPFYQNDASLSLEKEANRPTNNNAEDKYFKDQPKERKESKKE